MRRHIIRKSVKDNLLSEQIFAQKPSQDSTFWNDATRYAAASKDESFVEEVAYMMVTLHRTGA
ncbi:hypothetical protein NKOR_04665 [Candidatus Nitrosopumilus koreensis AR1]|uniref:Uncharacterized protein n=1 Tax=Candidatus Nitrosopumilus koreensis AR1 TaxID=1229908 RepID=K0B5T0_9ARCH|nr:hypothetical protein NKOR_04665 [Candidatus Nitrosopumilus koreensis AR1]